MTEQTEFQENKANIKRALWDNLPPGLFSADDIDFMAEALAKKYTDGVSEDGK